MNNRILKQVLIEAFTQDFNDIPTNEEIAKTHKFSKKYRAKMKKLEKKAKQKYIYIFNNPIRRMAVIAVCIIIIFTASLSIEAVRTPIVRFCVTIYEKFSAILFVSDADSELSLPTELEILYAPDYIPDGYDLIDNMNIIAMRYLIYANAAGDEIEFQQFIISSTDLILDTEGITAEDITINMNQGIFYTNKGFNNILWYDNQYGFLLIGTIEKTLLQRMAESIKTEK